MMFSQVLLPYVTRSAAALKAKVQLSRKRLAVFSSWFRGGKKKVEGEEDPVETLMQVTTNKQQEEGVEVG